MKPSFLNSPSVVCVSFYTTYSFPFGSPVTYMCVSRPLRVHEYLRTGSVSSSNLYFSELSIATCRLETLNKHLQNQTAKSLNTCMFVTESEEGFDSISDPFSDSLWFSINHLTLAMKTLIKQVLLSQDWALYICCVI